MPSKFIINFIVMYVIVRLFFCNILLISSSEATFTNATFNNDVIPRVVNGWPGRLGDVPYQIAFKALSPRSRSEYVTFCGGTILGPSKILTAAHCFVKNQNFCTRLFNQGGRKSLTHKYAVAGNLYNRGQYSPDSLENGQWRALRNLTYPSSYKFPRNDIAILFTEQPFVFNDHVNYIPYASMYADYVGQCLVSGFGRISKKTSVKITSDKLLLAHLTLLPARRCNRMMRQNMRRLICTSVARADVGKGDSGGPLVCRHTKDPNEDPNRGILVGVVSGSRPGVCSFFTRVSSFSKYIKRNRCNRIGNTILIQIQILLFLF